MPLNWGVEEDSRESLGLQGDPTSHSERKSVLNIHCKDWCWNWNSNTLATWWEELTHLKRLWCWERLKAGGEGGDRGWDGWMASLTRWTWVWVSSGSWWWTGKPDLAAVHGVAKSWTQATELNSRKEVTCRRYSFNPWVRKIPCRRKWQPHSIFLPGKSHAQGSLAGYNPWGHKRIRQDLATKQLQHYTPDKVFCFCIFFSWFLLFLMMWNLLSRFRVMEKNPFFFSSEKIFSSEKM